MPDLQREKIFFGWRAQYEQPSVNELRHTGRFVITGGTGLYEDLRGNGAIEGYFMCLPASAPQGCASVEVFSDGQYTMQGRYSDPSVATS